MSDAHDAHTPNAQDDHAHVFDGEPIQVLPPDEPRTPAYVPLLGVVLFVVAGVALLLTGDDSSSGAPSTEKTGAEAAPTPLANPLGARAAPGTPQPAGMPSAPSLTKLDPERARAAQQKIDEMRARQPALQPGAQPGPNPAGGAQPSPAQLIRPQPAPVRPPQPVRPPPPPATGPDAQ